MDICVLHAASSVSEPCISADAPRGIRFEALTEVSMTSAIFWVVMPTIRGHIAPVLQD
jgi:hypothetical protein